jgi:hypothetical protein
MKTDNQPTVKFSKEFIAPSGLKEWVGIEWPVGVEVDKEAIFSTLDKVRDAVLEWHQKNNQANAAFYNEFNMQVRAPGHFPLELPQKTTGSNSDPVIDAEFEQLKLALDTYEFREDAQAFLDTSETFKTFRLSIDAKKYINSKPSKNSQQHV